MKRRADRAQLVIRRSALSSYGQFDIVPWRSVITAATLLVAAARFESWWIWIATLIVSVSGVLSETWHAKDFVTRTHVIRQRGVFGRARTAVLLREVERVSVRECTAPQWRRDLVVQGKSTRLEFLGVRDARETCERIEVLRAQALRHQDDRVLNSVK